MVCERCTLLGFCSDDSKVDIINIPMVFRTKTQTLGNFRYKLRFFEPYVTKGCGTQKISEQPKHPSFQNLSILGYAREMQTIFPRHPNTY